MRAFIIPGVRTRTPILAIRRGVSFRVIVGIRIVALGIFDSFEEVLGYRGRNPRVSLFVHDGAGGDSRSTGLVAVSGTAHR